MIMNFKDAYKNMTEEIGTNKELLDSLITKASEKKQNIRSFKKSYVLAFATMLIMAFGIGFAGKFYFGFLIPDEKKDTGYVAYDVKEKREVNNPLVEDISRNSTDEFQNKDTFWSDETYAGEIPSVTPEDVVEEDSETAKSSRISLFEDSADTNFPGNNETEIYDEKGNDSDSVFHTPKVISEENEKILKDTFSDNSELLKEEKASSGGGGGSSASPVTNDTVSVEKYWEYIGFDVISKISLPYDIELFIPSSAVIKKQGEEILYDTFTVYGNSPDGKHPISISVSKISHLQTDFSISEKGVNIGICSDTLTDEEFSNIILSLK